MIKIILVGLTYDSNLGDYAIYDACKNCVEEILNNKGIFEYQIKTIDLYGRQHFQDNVFYERDKYQFIKNILKKLGFAKIKHLLLLKKLNRQLSIINQDASVIIFVGGGLIKYKNQFLAEPIIKVLKKAEKFRIPIMFSSVGIEGYDGKSKYCKQLQYYLNNDSVKIITTRDDIDCLNNNYITNNGIMTEKVNDIALLTSLFHKRTKKNTRKIGIGVARGNLFSDYQIPYSRALYQQLIINIIDECIDCGYEPFIFNNGFNADYIECENVKKMYESKNNREIEICSPKNLDDLCDIITECNAIIGTRMHSLVLAASYGIPFVGLEWNNKIHFFCDSIAKGDSCIKYNNFDAKTIFSTLLKQMNNPNVDMNYKAYDLIKNFIDENIIFE